jgi:HEAT repeat protein
VKHRALIALASVLVLGAAVMLLTRPNKSEPSYKGVRLSRWIATTSGASSGYGKSLAEIGPESIPYLRHALHTTDNPLRRASVWLWRQLPIATRIKYQAYQPVEGRQVRQNALWGLRFWGPEAREALPELNELAAHEHDLFNKSLVLHAMLEVGGWSPEALATFSRWLKSEDAITRSQAALAIMESPMKDSTLLPLLIENMKRSPDKPYNEILGLAAMGTNAAPALPVLIGALNDPATRNNTLTALRRLGTAAAPAVPSLIELIEHDELKMNASVIEVFFNVGPAASQAIPMLTKATASGDAVLRVMAAVALGRIQGDVDSAVPILIAELRNGHSGGEQHWEVWLPNMHIIVYDHRTTAAWFLGEIGPRAKDAVPELTNAMQGKQLRLTVLAARALWKITGRDGNVLKVLSQTLQNPDEIACVLAVQALGEMGADAKPAVPALLNARTNSLYVRRAVNEALKKIDSETAEKAIYHGPR